MSDKLEQAMKKIHIYLANCKEGVYSSEELIVSKKRIFSLLEELNYAVYDVMEEYEISNSLSVFVITDSLYSSGNIILYFPSILIIFCQPLVIKEFGFMAGVGTGLKVTVGSGVGS